MIKNFIDKLEILVGPVFTLITLKDIEYLSDDRLYGTWKYFWMVIDDFDHNSFALNAYRKSTPYHSPKFKLILNAFIRSVIGIDQVNASLFKSSVIAKVHTDLHHPNIKK